VERRIVIEVPSRTILRALFLSIAALAAVRLIGAVRDVLLLIGVSLFLAVMLTPLVAMVERWLSRGLAVFAVWLGVLLSVLVFLGVLIAPLATQVDNLAKAAPSYIEDLKRNSTFRELNDRYQIVTKAQEAVGKIPSRAFGAAGTVATTVANSFTVLFLTLFLMYELPAISSFALSLLRPDSADRARLIGSQIQRNISGYVAGNLLISVIAGLTTLVPLLLMDVPYAVALALVLAFFDLIPLIGATIGAIAVIGVTAATAGVVPAIVMIVIQVAYQQVENHILQPIVYRRTVQLSAVVILVAILLGAKLLGVLGALVAIPIAGSIQLVIREVIDERRRRGDLPPLPPPPDAEAAPA
jgi:predicted PurR-regulated permease PerM